ncbi:hypothetical protein FIBSPDRAFT_854002 [Athelia psychrophila]|uniref:Uncharacterized protein n=1 Tax=Athelia psychrophila TaxID=1759441 RepID=A0A166QJ13_9AGAM|nr:hypothetical protein FIBSPDRAFT_854002 [Fibularhizoctonia sp. CBS 109695]
MQAKSSASESARSRYHLRGHGTYVRPPLLPSRSRSDLTFQGDWHRYHDHLHVVLPLGDEPSLGRRGLVPS